MPLTIKMTLPINENVMGSWRNAIEASKPTIGTPSMAVAMLELDILVLAALTAQKQKAVASGPMKPRHAAKVMLPSPEYWPS